MKYSTKELDEMLDKYNSLPEIKEKKLIKRNNTVNEIKKNSITNNDILTTFDRKSMITIPIISLKCWIKKYGNYLPEEINIITLDISGVLSEEYLLLKVPHPNGGIVVNGKLKGKDDKSEEGLPRKELLVFKNSDNIPVLDLNISEILVYSSGIKIVHPYKNGFIKTYVGKKNYLVATFTDDKLIPYDIKKVKNSNTLIYKENNLNISEFYDEIADLELIRLLYPIINKSKKKIRTNRDVCEYFLDIQKNIRDSYHNIKIDNIIIGMLTGRFPENSNLAVHVNYQDMLVF